MPNSPELPTKLQEAEEEARHLTAALAAELRSLTLGGLGVTALTDSIDIEVDATFPALAGLARARFDLGRADTIVWMITEAVKGLSEEWRKVAPTYLGLRGTARGPHIERQRRAATDLGVLRRDRPYSTSNFRQHEAGKLFEDIAKKLQHLEYDETAERELSPAEEFDPIDWVRAEHVPAEGQMVVVVAATPGMRDGPRSSLVQFIREVEPYIRSAGHMLRAIDGSYAALWRAGLLHDYKPFLRLPAGIGGGLVHATELILGTPTTRNPVVVVYLIDPRDASARYPVATALKRACVAKGVPFLTSLASALRWFRLQWAVHVLDEPGATRDPVADHLLLSATEAQILGSGPLASGKGIALAAHDRHKHALLEFATDHRDFLTSGFDTRYATAVTGRLLNGVPIGDARMSDFGRYDMSDDQLKREIQKIRSWQTAQPSASADWFRLVTHGREGGLIQLARRVIDGEITTCVFFQDAATPRESDTELQVLDRAAQLAKVDCLTLYDSKSASMWANSRKRIRERGVRVSSTTLVQAFKQAFNVDLVLAYDIPTKRADEGPWKTIVKCAATYFLEAVISAVRHHDRLHPATVGMSWGGAVRNVVDMLGSAPPRLGSSGKPGALGVREYIEKNMRTPGELEVKGSWNDWEVTDLSGAIGGAISPWDLTVVPLVGIMGTVQPGIESHALVESVTGVFGGSTLSHSEYAFRRRTSDEPLGQPESSPTGVDNGDGEAQANGEKQFRGSGELTNAWARLDIALCSCDAIRSDLVSVFPADMRKALNKGGAIGEFGHIYLRRDNVAQRDYGGYQSTGIPQDVLQGRVSHGADVILVAGVQKSRELPAWAAIRAGLVSTFITDTRLAWNVLCREHGRRFTPLPYPED